MSETPPPSQPSAEEPTSSCPGRLVVIYEHYYGGWSSDCENSVEVECPEAKCYWFDRDAHEPRKQVDVDELIALQAAHDKWTDEMAALLVKEAGRG